MGIDPMLRAFAERLTRDLQYRRRMPVELGGGDVWVSPSAGLRYLFRALGDIDPVLMRLAAQFVKPGSVVWDIGANVGLFTFASAHLCGKGGSVLAVEPDTLLVQLLNRSVPIQPVTSGAIKVVQAAVAQSVDLRTFCIADRSRSANFLKGYGSTQAGGIAQEQTVVSVTLDWLAERVSQPDVVKIDIEGAEEEALIGGMELLKRKRPVLLCEVSTKASAGVSRSLGMLDYRIFNGEVPEELRKELTSAPWNTVAIPR